VISTCTFNHHQFTLHQIIKGALVQPKLGPSIIPALLGAFEFHPTFAELSLRWGGWGTIKDQQSRERRASPAVCPTTRYRPTKQEIFH
jgi:hypothetical protein